MSHLVLELIGWAGSAVLVFSVLQSRFLRFRIINALASAILVFYNACLGVWPAVVMNLILVGINVYFLVTLLQQRNEGKVFSYTPASQDKGLLNWFIDRHRDDIASHYPSLGERLAEGGIESVVLFHQDRAIGLVVIRRDGPHSAELLADYVIPDYRDFAPGSFVYSPTGPLAAAGLSVIWVVRPAAPVRSYLTTMGFERDQDDYVREIAGR